MSNEIEKIVNENKFANRVIRLDNNICVWYNSSTNPHTKKMEMPEVCKIQRCLGYNLKCSKYQAKGESDSFIFMGKKYEI